MIRNIWLPIDRVRCQLPWLKAVPLIEAARLGIVLKRVEEDPSRRKLLCLLQEERPYPCPCASGETKI